MKTINYNSQTLEISDEDFEWLQQKYASKSGRFEPEKGQTYITIGTNGGEFITFWRDDWTDKSNYILGLVHSPSKPFDLEREKARIDLLHEVTKIYHKHVDPLEWKRDVKQACYFPSWNDRASEVWFWYDCFPFAFAFPNAIEGKAACLAFANEVGIDRWKKLCEYGIL